MKKRLIMILGVFTFCMPLISVSAVTTVHCGNITRIPAKIPELTSLMVTVVQIAVPIVLVIMGSIDLLKGITAQKEDELKKGQQMLIKRLIIAAIIFFVIAIVKFAVSLVVDTTNSENIVDCIDCFLSDKCRKR